MKERNKSNSNHKPKLRKNVKVIEHEFVTPDPTTNLNIKLPPKKQSQYKMKMNIQNLKISK